MGSTLMETGFNEVCCGPTSGHGCLEADSEALSGTVVLADYEKMEYTLCTYHP